MPVESVPAVRPPLRLRADLPDDPFDSAASPALIEGGISEGRWFDRVGRPMVVALAGFFVLLGGANLDLNATDARLGLATDEALGPIGRVAGFWDPSVWPIPVAWGHLAGWFEDSGPTQNAIRWPAAIAGCLIGYLLTRRGRLGLNPRAGVMVAVTWFGSLALMDRSSGLQIDLMTGLGTVAALDLMLAGGSGWAVGFWAGWAFLAGGWPPLAVLVLTTVVLGRAGTVWNWRTSLRVLAVVVAWSAWAISRAGVEAWASALTLPIMQGSVWWLAPLVLAAGCPWSPFVALMACRSVRDQWAGPTRSLVFGWLQVTGACLVVGSIIPGLASAAAVPALAGLAFVAASVWDRLWAAGATSPTARRTLAGLTMTITGLWLLLVLTWGGSVGFTIAYYRSVMIAALAFSVVGFFVGVVAVQRADPRRGFAALALVAVALKLAHWGYFVPELNYRTSAGPWGRAIAQWVPEGHTIHTLHAWPNDLNYAMRRPIHQLQGPQLLEFQPGKGSKFLLLLDSEFEEYQAWSEGWPKLVKVAEFQDEFGIGKRILTRTEGPIILGHPHKKNSAFD